MVWWAYSSHNKSHGAKGRGIDSDEFFFYTPSRVDRRKKINCDQKRSEERFKSAPALGSQPAKSTQTCRLKTGLHKRVEKKKRIYSRRNEANLKKIRGMDVKQENSSWMIIHLH